MNAIFCTDVHQAETADSREERERKSSASRFLGCAYEIQTSFGCGQQFFAHGAALFRN
jgi:hypothetical protein